MLAFRICGVLGLVVQCGAAFAQAEPREVLAGLIGSCWRTQMDDTGPNSDTHCFEATVGGKLVTDTHKVRNPKGEVVYEGVSAYTLDKASGALVYHYFNSNGGMLVGYGVRAGNEIRFGSKPGQATPDLVWKLSSDSYTVTPAGADKGHVGTFVKVGLPAAGGP